MTEPRLHHVQCLDNRGLHRMAYWEHGEPGNRKVVVCVHGLSRQGRDFDRLAAALRDEFRVVCPDVVGRGESDRLADPAGYALPAYVADMVTLLARLDADELSWVGTSMGGLIGLGVASLAGSPLHRLVLNDVGPAIEPAAVARIGAYLGQPLSWASADEAAAYLRGISQGFGTHSDDEWRQLSKPMLRERDGRIVLHYDPAIALPIRAMTPELATAGEAALWRAYDALTLPTLLLRGADSDLLSPATAAAMTQRGPRARLVEFAGVGHAPMLTAPEQIAVVREFLQGGLP